jgi:ABC-type multidrug transport system ATPase subunit
LNGAGKSTTFKLLTKQMEATSGTFEFGPHSSEPLRMGYCPQTDALDKLLTVKETLHIYCKLRGIPSSMIEPVNLLSILKAFNFYRPFPAALGCTKVNART